jgi:hypothetical protein
MVTALMATFLEAKMRDAKTSVALYLVGRDLDAAKIVRQMAVRSNKAIVEMLAFGCAPPGIDPQLVVGLILGFLDSSSWSKDN